MLINKIVQFLFNKVFRGPLYFVCIYMSILYVMHHWLFLRHWSFAPSIILPQGLCCLLPVKTVLFTLGHSHAEWMTIFKHSPPFCEWTSPITMRWPLPHWHHVAMHVWKDRQALLNPFHILTLLQSHNKKTRNIKVLLTATKIKKL